jgi:hypothetical protein
MENLSKRAAGEFLMLKIVSEYLGTDPEIADEYLYRFIKTWGKEGVTAVRKFIEWCVYHDKEEIIKDALEHDFALEKKEGVAPRVWGYMDYESDNDPSATLPDDGEVV